MMNGFAAEMRIKIFMRLCLSAVRKVFFGILKLLETNTHIPCAFQANNGL